MKFQAPAGVTALFCAGETLIPDEGGVFDAAPSVAPELAAHGCVPREEAAAPEKVEPRPRVNRARLDKAD